MTPKLAVPAVAALVAAVVIVPVHLLADVSSCSLATSSYADSVINPPKGEDTDFFVSSGGVPNLMFVLDTSGSMVRMPPDGAEETWGTFEKAGNAVVGAGYGCTNAYANARVYSSPCGSTTLEGSPYNPTPGAAPPDFAQAKDSTGKYCPYMVSGAQPPATNKPGFDPDFYPEFFNPVAVYRDGTWSDTNPNAASASIAGFCASFAGAKQTSCTTCLNDQGYWFEGGYPTATTRRCGNSTDCKLHGQGTCLKGGLEYNGVNDGSARCAVPRVYFTGNFLNFYPPKFIVARKVLKDVLQAVRKVRLGLATFNGSVGGDKLIDLSPQCNMFGSPSNFDSARGSIKNKFDGSGGGVRFAGVTPLAETLLNVGQYYRTADLPWFNTADGRYKPNEWEPQSGNQASVCFTCQASTILLITDGIPNQDGVIPDSSFAAAPMTKAVAKLATSYAGMGGYNITGISTADCPSCETWAELADTAVASGSCFGNQDSGACDDGSNPIKSYLPRVAWYLNNLDFRRNAELDSANAPFTDKQSITTYTIGLGTQGAATEILRHTAEAGGGLFNGGTGSDVIDVKSLKDAIMKVLEDVNSRSTSFGSASLSTLQVATTQGVLVPRFEPARSAHWDGHLYAFDLYSEFTSGVNTVAGKVKCVQGTTRGPDEGDYDCDGKCDSVFLIDKDNAFIQEDGTGAFVKNTLPDRAACGNGSRCTGAACSDAGTALATPFWDAGGKLAPVKKERDASGNLVETRNAGVLEWRNRRIFTVVDQNGDGKLTSADPVIDLRSVDPATMVPYLNLRGTRYCGGLAQRLLAAGNPVGATIDGEVGAGNFTTCARMLLNFVRGADIFNERKNDPTDPACGTSYPSITNPNGSYCTRKYQLGDIFHSSPVEVWPPFASDGFACPRGLSTQCLTALFSPSIPNPSADGYGNAYDDYAKSSRYKNRRKFALVGANDGMLHAFQIERTISGSANPNVGEEIWAFIPPDLLAKLRLLTESTHHFFVDGTPMVRDVWLDGGSLNKLRGGGSRGPDGQRQGDEFHTVAVVGERRGGTHYFALDITEASDDLEARPGFLWLYPQPNDPEQLRFGETYVEFVPNAPPIGPVRLEHGAPPCNGNYPLYTPPTGVAGDARCFEERYVVMLSGGFDPQYTKGRGVHMVDIATGEEIWDFSQPPGSGSTCTSASDPRCKLNYPVAATVAMMAWGDQPTYTLSEAQRGYFDTATFGDTGGQLWVLRFADPGRGWSPGTGAKVTNWYGARAFQNGLGLSTPACGLDYCAGVPFFYITANVALAENDTYRVLAGTGDRFNLLDSAGGQCSPENLRACLLKGCSVTLNDGTAALGPGAVFGVETLLGTQTYKMNNPARCSATPVADFTFGAAGGSTSGTCGASVQKVDRITITCPREVTCGGAAETTTKQAAVTCSADSCDAARTNDFGIPIDLIGNPDVRNQFFSIRVWEPTGSARTIFRTADEARAYDNARLKDSDLKDLTAYDRNPIPANLASPSDRGWRYPFSHGEPDPNSASTVLLSDVVYNVYRTDERNASVPGVEEGCSFWNTMQAATPTGSLFATTECPKSTPCKAGRAQLSYLYGADPGNGGLCLTVNGALARAQRNDTLVPPHMGKMVAYVSGSQVAFGLTSVRVPQGGANVSLGAAQDLAAMIEWLPVDKATHACRHSTRKDASGNLIGPTADECK